MLTRALILTSLLIAAAVRAENPAAAAQSAYSKNGCSITFPKDWKIDSPAGTTAFVFASSPEVDTANGQQQAATILIARIAMTKPDLMALAKKYQAGDLQNKNYKPVETPADLTINAAPAVRFGGTYTAAGKQLRNRVWLIAEGGMGGGGDTRVYIVTFTSLAATCESRIATADAAIATFKILDEKK